MPIKSYRDLVVWQRAMDLVENIYRFSRCLPSSERFGLTSQMQRAAVSIPANIAEGHARRSRREYLQFVSIASGSAAELETHLAICERLGYDKDQTLGMLYEQARGVGRMLIALELALKKPRSTSDSR